MSLFIFWDSLSFINIKHLLERQWGKRREKFNCWKALQTHSCINSQITTSLVVLNNTIFLQYWMSKILKQKMLAELPPLVGSRGESSALHFLTSRSHLYSWPHAPSFTHSRSVSSPSTSIITSPFSDLDLFSPPIRIFVIALNSSR